MDDLQSVVLGGRYFQVRPLTLSQARRHKTAIAAMTNAAAAGGPFDNLVACLPLLAEALGMPDDEAGDMITIKNWIVVWKALMAVDDSAEAAGESAPVQATPAQ